MQRIFNYGSFLQAYGLKSILEELGAQVAFVDYHPGECLVPSNGHGLTRKLKKAAEVFSGGAPLLQKLRFLKYKKNYAANYYPYLGIGAQMNYTPELDLLVVGSDEVFNCVQNNTNVGFSPELFGQGHRAGRLVSYAASCGNTTLQKLEEYGVKETVAGWLSDFDALSVRDANTGAVTGALTGKEPLYHLDPVLAYDFVAKCKQIPKTVPEKDYMILYGYSGRFSPEECRAIRAFADARGWKIFCIGGVQDCCDRFIDCSPFEVIAYFQNARAVVTDTFHGTILSVITHRDFAALVRTAGYGNAEKLTDLLNRLGLENRRIGDMTELGALLENSVDYTATDAVIRTERERTYAYLKQQLDCAKA